jgi:hypothetical protein
MSGETSTGSLAQQTLAAQELSRRLSLRDYLTKVELT